MFEEIYDNVLSALSDSGFINWFNTTQWTDGLNHNLSPLCSTCVCLDCKSIKTLPSNLKYKTFNFEHSQHTPHYNVVDLNEL